MSNIKKILTVFIVVLHVSTLSAQETKRIKGRIVSENLELLPGANIHDLDTTLLGSTDLDGYFEIEVPSETDRFLVGFIGMEWMTVEPKDDCQNLEMILLSAVIYDFIPLKRVNKKRKKRVRQLPRIHKDAYKNGYFESSTPCVCYMFKESKK